MRRTIITLASIVFVLIFSVSFAGAAEKFASVDLAKLFDDYEKTKLYDKELEKKQDALESERKEKVDAIKEIQDSLSLLSDKEKASKEKDVEEKIASLRRFDRDKSQDLRKQRDEKMKDILEDIEASVEQYAKKKGFTLVFNDQVLIYKNDSLDVTDQVLKLLQKKYKK